MITRTTEKTISARVMANLQGNLNRVQTLQDQLSSGKRINKPSDDPSGTANALQLRSTKSRNEQYSRNAQDGMGWLGTADDTLQSVSESIQNVRKLVLQAANGTSDDAARQAIADEIETAKQTIIGLANTSYAGRPIFSGTMNPETTYGTDGTYNGNTGAIYRTVGPNASVQVNLDGPAVFGDPAVDDLWSTLDDIYTHLTSGEPGATKLTSSYDDGSGTTVASDLDRLDVHRLNVQNRLSEVGARYNRIETMQTRADNNVLTMDDSLANIESIDLPQTIIDLQLQNTAYQAALASAAKVIQPSLVDFIS